MHGQTLLRCRASFSRLPADAAPRPSRPSPRPATLSSSRQQLSVRAAFAPPPVAQTKLNFFSNYKHIIPGVYAGVLQELLVQQHFMRYASNYEYNKIYALGVYSVFEQILEGLEEGTRSRIFDSYIRAFGEDPDAYRRDALTLEQEAAGLGPADLLRDGGDLQKMILSVGEKVAAGKLGYNRFFAIGLFRLLEITGAKEPSALEALVKAVGVKQEAVNRDLIMYKNVLTKLNTAKELMRDILDREKRKQAERELERAAAAAAAPAVATDLV